MSEKVAAISGAGHGIGLAIRKHFEALGVKVYGIDIKAEDCYKGDVGDKETLEAFAQHVLKQEDHVDYLINNAPPLMKGISECSYEEFDYALRVGVSAATPYSLPKTGIE